MKILQSSDFHLNKDHPERTEALDRVLEAGVERNVEALLIAGDLFDSRADTDFFRPMLRDKFSSLPFKVYLIPGNHDYGSFEGDLFFGNQIEILAKQPFQVVELEEVRLVAVPYFNQDFNDYALDIGEAASKSKLNILLIHCSLDAPFISGEDYGAEKGESYMPVSSHVLSELGFQYILAGHYHTRFMVRRISNKTSFVYCGSPVSITKKETGLRFAAMVDTEQNNITSVGLKTRYYDQLGFEFEPGSEQQILEKAAEEIASHDPKYANLQIIFDGWTSKGEKRLKQEIEHMLSGLGQEHLDVGFNYRDAAEVLSDPLYKSFKQKLKDRNLEEGLEREIGHACRLFLSRLKYER
jgi:DNA repair protein SbcD/Mre11